MATPDTTSIERELDRIRSLSIADLRLEWQRHNRSAPPKLSRDLLALALGHQLQERECGGLSKSTRRKLQSAAKGLQATGRIGPSPSLSLKPGVRLVREWRGRTHAVTVMDDGFAYEGTSYRSLTRIAQKITGAHWSGPRFFGLPATGPQQPKAGQNRDG